MASLSGVLANIPGLGGYAAGQEEDRTAQMAQLQQMGILQKIAQQKQAMQEQQQMKAVVQQTGGDPKATIEKLIATGNPKAIELATKMHAFLPKPAEPFTLSPGAQRFDASGRVIAQVAQKPDKAPEIIQMTEMYNTLPEGDPRKAILKKAIDAKTFGREEAIRLAAALRPPPAEKPVQPLVAIVGPDGNPVLVPREEAVGKTPWAAGSAITKAGEKVMTGRETVNSLVATLRDQYDQLSKSGGITDPSKGTASNVMAGIASSAPGQFVGRVVGSKDQSVRNQIAQQRPLLLNAIKQATGMTAKQMDSNAELKLYLAASTDPTLDIKANLAALDKIDELYGLGGGGKTAPAVVREFATEEEAIKSGVKGKVRIGGRNATIK